MIQPQSIFDLNDGRFYAQLLTTLEQAVIATDLHGIVNYWNPFAVKLYGWTVEEALGRSIVELNCPQISQQQAETIMERLQAGESWLGEFLVQDRNGRIFTALVTDTPIIREGRLVGIVGVSSDISVRKRAEDRIYRLQELTAALSRAATPLQLAQTCMEHSLRAFGAAAGEVYHADSGSHWLELLYSCGLPETLLTLRRQLPVGTALPSSAAFYSRQPLLIESPQQLAEHYPDLAPIACDAGFAALTALPLLYEGHRLGVLSLWFTQPHTFNADDQALLRSFSQQCAHALERSRLLEAEQAARKVAERTAERMAHLQSITAAISELLTPAQVAEVIVNQTLAALQANSCIITQFSADGSLLESIPVPGIPEYRYPLHTTTPLVDAARSGELVVVESRAALLERYPHLAEVAANGAHNGEIAIPLTANGRILGAMGVGFAQMYPLASDDRAFMLALAQQCAQALERARLYEAERVARAEAQTAVQLRDAFFSLAAHELKTPLTSLMGQAQLFQRRVSREGTLNDRDRRSLQIIVDQAGRLNRLIATLLDISRIQTGQLSLEQTRFDLDGLIRRVITELEPTLNQHTLLYQPPADPVLIEGDELRLDQVFQNLVQNAVNYSPQGGGVMIQLAHAGDQAVVTVSDQGIGIPEEALPHLFQRFYRAPNVARQHMSGLGVGLFVVKEVVSLHGGSVTVQSVEGQGTTFTIYLPLKKCL